MIFGGVKEVKEVKEVKDNSFFTLQTIRILGLNIRP